MDVHDIKERDISDIPVIPPNPQIISKEKPRKQSRWKSRSVNQSTNQAINQATNQTTNENAPSVQKIFGDNISEEEKIHLENLKKLSSMKDDEIEHERKQIIDMMNPEILQSLLRRAEIKEQSNEPSNVQKRADQRSIKKTDVDHDVGLTKDSSIDESIEHDTERTRHDTERMQHDNKTTQGDLDAIQSISNPNTIDDIQDSSETVERSTTDALTPNTTSSLHFPRSQQPPINFNDPDFLSKLHDKYFPELQIESDKMEWMKPIDESGPESQEYSPNQDSLVPSEIRFDFRGDIITPRRSRQIDPIQGLHHHGDAPLAAGYTIGELGHLARSTNQSQRCLAIQTLGRILYKLETIKNSYLHAGLQGCIDQYRIIDTLTEATGDKNSLSVQAYATEALWYFTQKQRRSTRIAA